MSPSMDLVIDATGKKLSENDIQKYVEELRELITADINYAMRKDDVFLMRYLHCTGFVLSDAHKRIKLMSALRLEAPEWFVNNVPSAFNKVLSFHAKIMLRGRDRCGRRIYYTRTKNVNTSKTSMLEMAQFDDLWLEAVLDEAETQANGLCCLIDMEGYSWKMFRWLTPNALRIASKCTEYAPVKKIVFHIINTSALLNASIAITFPFLSAKIKEHIHFHYNDWPSLHKHIDPQHLPKEYGGLLESIDFSEQNKWLIDQTPRLLENFKNDNRL